MTLKRWSTALTLLAALLPADFLHAACQTVAITKSATIARDVNGIALGTTIRAVAQRYRVIPINSEDFALSDGTTQFDVSVTPLGRIYRIEAKRHLGAFLPDQAFTDRLTQVLVQKYGRPVENQLPGAWIRWELIEVIKEPGMIPTNSRTNEAVMTLNNENGIETTDMMMIDLRILWQDQAAINCKPTRDSEAKLKF